MTTQDLDRDPLQAKKKQKQKQKQKNNPVYNLEIIEDEMPRQSVGYIWHKATSMRHTLWIIDLSLLYINVSFMRNPASVSTSVWLHQFDFNETHAEKEDLMKNIQEYFAAFFLSWEQHHPKHRLYGCLPLISQVINVRQAKHAEHGWRSIDELISDVLFCIPTYNTPMLSVQQKCTFISCMRILHAVEGNF